MNDKSVVTMADLYNARLGNTCVDMPKWRRNIVGLMASGDLNRAMELEQTYSFLLTN